MRIKIQTVGKPYKAPDLQRAVNTAVDQEKERILQSYRATMATWRKKPRFRAYYIGNGYVVGTDSAIYTYVDLGTRPHLIRVRYAKYLNFRTGYRAKTVPNMILSRNGGSFGGWRRAKQVKHPGTKARNFSKIIVKSAQKHLENIIKVEVNNAIQRAERS